MIFDPTWLMCLSEGEAIPELYFYIPFADSREMAPCVTSRPSPEIKPCFLALILDFLALPLSTTGMCICPLWRECSVAKITCCSCVGTRSSFKYPHGGWQLSTIPIPGDVMTPSDLCRHQVCTWCTCIHTVKAFIHTK